MKRFLPMIAAMLMAATASHGATLTSNTLTAPSNYDFSVGSSQSTTGPVTRSIGSFSLTFSASASSVFDFANYFGLADNSRWDSGRNGFAGLNAEVGTMTFTFSETVSAVGGLINYATGWPASPVLAIFDSLGGLIESFDLGADAPISTPGANNAGAFRGFDVGTNTIKSFTLSNSFIVIDDLVISQAEMPAIPLPAGLPLLVAGLGLLGAVRLRQRREG